MVTTLLTGCTGSSGGTADRDDGPPLPNAAMDYGTMRDVRYCEVIPSVDTGGTVTSSVYNTFGHDPCPDSEWSALTEQIVNQQFGSQSAELTGPRHWVFDTVLQPGDQATDPRIYQFAGVPGRTFTFGSIEIGLLVELQTAADQPLGDEKPLHGARVPPHRRLDLSGGQQRP